MNRDFCTMYQDALAKAFIVLTPQGKRLAVFPYGAGEDDVPEKQARKHAWLFLNRTNGQEAESEVKVELPLICRTCAKCGNPCDRGIIGLEVGDVCEGYKRKGGAR